MNKYQEAWDFIKINFYDEEWLESDAYSDYKKESFRLMQELVEKATPKKPIFYDAFSAKCPACGHLYEEGIDDYGADYCIMCGQRLDWGEEDE